MVLYLQTRSFNVREITWWIPGIPLAVEVALNYNDSYSEHIFSYVNNINTIEGGTHVAINECYLKKGFKEMFGTTIFDFYQNQRMEHARYLLYEKGLSVSEVSLLLGYSSISHFSTAFKKHTGLKPCELLIR